MKLPESITKKDLEKLITYLKSSNFLTTEKSIISFRNKANSLSEEDFSCLIQQLIQINK